MHTMSPAAIHRNVGWAYDKGYLVHNHSDEARRLRGDKPPLLIDQDWEAHRG